MSTTSNVIITSTFSLPSSTSSSLSSSSFPTTTLTSLSSTADTPQATSSSMSSNTKSDNESLNLDYQTNMNGTNTSNNSSLNNSNGYELSSLNNNNNSIKNDSYNDLANNSSATTATTTGGDSFTSASLSSNNNNSIAYSNNNHNSSSSSSNTSNADNNSSNNNNSNNNNNNNQQDDVCRDFLRNVCRRGKSCRYKHPDANDTEFMKNKDQYVFCHDFQNRECRRDNCRFLHCTKQEEEIYRNTGKLPPHIQAQLNHLDERNLAPICKDFLNNTCRRGPRCKYRHPLPANDFPPYGHHHSQQVHHSSQSNPTGRGGNQFNGRAGNNYPNSHIADYSINYSRAGSNSGNMPSNYGSYDAYTDSPQNKRKRYDPQSSMYHLENNGPYSGGYQEPPPPPPSGSVRNSYAGGNSMHDPPYGASGGAGGYPNSQASRTQQPPSIDSSRSYLEEENAALRRRIDDLKKQVQDLLSTNEYLMEQMNQIRASGQAAVAAACAPHGATSVASLQPQPAPGSVQTTAPIGMSAPITLQAPAQAAVAIGPLPPVSIVSSIASISLPTVSAPVTLVPNSSAAAYTPSMATMHSTTPWPLGVDQLLKNDL